MWEDGGRKEAGALKETRKLAAVSLTLLILLTLSACAGSGTVDAREGALDVSVVHGETDVARASLTRPSGAADGAFWVMLRVQYRVGNNYYWYPEEGYLFKSGQGLDAVTAEIARDYIYYAEALFRSGDELYRSEWRRPPDTAL